MTDEDEAVVRTYDYFVYGEITDYSGTLTLANPFTYTARERELNSGLYYYRASSIPFEFPQLPPQW